MTLLPLALLLIVEGCFALLGIAEPPRFFEVVEVDAPDESGARSVVRVSSNHPWASKDRSRFEGPAQGPGLPIDPRSFEATPPADRYRVVCLGGSTVNGFPFAPDSSFPKRLEARLRALHPDRDVEVLCAGIPGRNAWQLAALGEEILEFDVDLLVIYTGHNEFLPWNLPPLLHPRSAGAREWLARSRIGRWLIERLPGAGPNELHLGRKQEERRTEIHVSPELSSEVIDRGMRRYRSALNRLATAARDAECAVVLCVPVCNLRDDRPLRSTFRADLPEAERDPYLQMLATARRLSAGGQWEESLAILEDLATTDPSVAIVAYERARVCEELDQLERSRELFGRARDLDVPPQRAGARHFAVLEEVAAELGLPLADPLPLFVAAAGGRAPGDESFIDLVHPRLGGQREIATAVLSQMARRDLLRAAEDWDFSLDLDFEEENRAIGYDPSAVASRLTRRGLKQLLLCVEQGLSPPRAVNSAFQFALRNDGDHAAAVAGMALFEIVEGRDEEARSLIRKALAIGETAARAVFQQAANESQHLGERLGRLMRLEGLAWE